MARLPVLEGRDLVRLLGRRGFQLLRIHGSHARLVHPDGRKTTVPMHSGKALPKGTLQAILRDCELTRDDLVEA